MTDIYITFEDKYIPEYVYKSNLPEGLYFHFYDELTKTGKKDAYKLKSEWGARKSPFALVCDKDNPIKAFYSEADNDIINSLINFINENSSN